MKQYFLKLYDLVNQKLNPEEKVTAWFSAEDFDYARFNHAKIRQAGSVNQINFSLDLINQNRHSYASIGLSKNLVEDEKLIEKTLNSLRKQIEVSSDDPFLMINEEPESSEMVHQNQLQEKDEIVNFILSEAKDLDLVGTYFGGPIYRGFFNSLGQKNWFEKSSFVFDASAYHSTDKAVKLGLSDERFCKDSFSQKLKETRVGLELFKRPSETISPGNYRVYFSPKAVYEILGMLNWGGFSHKALAVKSSPLLALQSGEKSLSSKFSLWENLSVGVGPNFQGEGFIKPNQLALIEKGKLTNTLVSPKSAKEYNIEHNGAGSSEGMASMEMAAGDLEKQAIHETLGDGLYINNLWYLNYSDHQNGCLTGMTRFLSYTVKDGKPHAPFSVMRFDESIYNIFGAKLSQVEKERELIIDNGTYEERETSSALLPGIIVDDFRFTL